MKTIYKYKARNNIPVALILVLLIIITGILVATIIYTIKTNPLEEKISYLN